VKPSTNQADWRPVCRTVIALGLILALAQLAWFVNDPGISGDGRQVADVAYAVVVALALAGWAGIVGWSVASIAGGGPRGGLAPRVSLWTGLVALGLGIALLFMAATDVVNGDGATLTAFAATWPCGLLVWLAVEVGRRARPVTG
jgi:hypothetical protein